MYRVHEHRLPNWAVKKGCLLLRTSCGIATIRTSEYERIITIRVYLLTFRIRYDILVYNLISQTVEAEITAMMPLQRACDAESQARNKLSNGPLRAQSKEQGGLFRVFCDVVGRRHLPGICWYPAKCIGSFL